MGYWQKLATAMVVGHDNLIEKLLEKKFEDLGEEFINKMLGGPWGLSQGIMGLVERGDQSQFNKLGSEWIKQAIGRQAQIPHSGFLYKVGKMVGQQVYGADPDRRSAWGRSSWATSRDDWLDNHWRHDWRSQPRDAKGKWIPGRLDYIPMYLRYRGKSRPGRGRLRRRKMRRLARLRGRRAARRMVKSMKKGGK